jgi:uncharacterized protein YaiI (UPF0178 family)
LPVQDIFLTSTAGKRTAHTYDNGAKIYNKDNIKKLMTRKNPKTLRALTFLLKAEKEELQLVQKAESSQGGGLFMYIL